MDRRTFFTMAPAFPASAMAASLVLREEGREPLELDVRVLKIQSGDTLVLTAPGPITQDQAERIKQFVEHKFTSVKAMVCGDGLRVAGVLRGPDLDA